MFVTVSVTLSSQQTCRQPQRFQLWKPPPRLRFQQRFAAHPSPHQRRERAGVTIVSVISAFFAPPAIHAPILQAAIVSTVGGWIHIAKQFAPVEILAAVDSALASRRLPNLPVPLNVNEVALVAVCLNDFNIDKRTWNAPSSHSAVFELLIVIAILTLKLNARITHK